VKIVKSKEVYRSKIFRVTEDVARDKSGFEIRRAIVRHPGAAVMLATDEKKRVLLVRQFRLPAGRFLWELPAGTLDPGEKPLQTAKRELTEETGYSAKNWKKLVEYYPSPGYAEERMTIFHAKNLTEGKASPMEDERIECRWFTKKEFANLVRTNEVMDSKTMIGYLYWAKLGARKAGKKTRTK
jgi:ADP-ribose pyrophosphatase